MKCFTKKLLFGILLAAFYIFCCLTPPIFALTTQELEQQIAEEERRMTIIERRAAYYEDLIKKAGEKERGILGQITQSFRSLGRPLLIGHSRKGFIKNILNKENPESRLYGTMAVSAYCAGEKVELVRVHDVEASHDVLEVIDAIREAEL